MGHAFHQLSLTSAAPDNSCRHVWRQGTTAGVAVLCDLCVPLRRNNRLDLPFSNVEDQAADEVAPLKGADRKRRKIEGDP
jgi:hypothetical protein